MKYQILCLSASINIIHAMPYHYRNYIHDPDGYFALPVTQLHMAYLYLIVFGQHGHLVTLKLHAV